MTEDQIIAEAERLAMQEQGGITLGYTVAFARHYHALKTAQTTQPEQDPARITALEAENERMKAALEAERALMKEISGAVNALHKEVIGPHEELCSLCGELYGYDALYLDDGRRLCGSCDEARQALGGHHDAD